MAPGDNFHPENGHVIPALMQKFNSAVKKVSQLFVGVMEHL